jgi:hypothetical protein
VKGAANESTPYDTLFPTKLYEIEFENGDYPTKLKFEVEAITNHKNGVSLGEVENFIVKNDNNSLAEIDFALTVPLYVKIEEFSRSDVVAFDYNDIINNDEKFSNGVENMTINLEIVNNLPFEVTLSAIAVDDADNHVETILEEESGSIYFKKEMQYITIRLIKSQLDRFRSEEVKKIIFHTTAKTPNQEGYMKIEEDSSLDIGVSIQFTTGLPNIFD